MHSRRSGLQSRKRLAAAITATTAALAVTLTAATPAPAADDLAALKAKYSRPASIPFPADNPFSEAKARLGHALFFDPRLSGNDAMSCASCHNPALGWEDGLKTGMGWGAKALGRATPTVLNLAWGELLMWDGRKNSLEDQATGPIEADVEMNLPLPKLVAKLEAVPGYRAMFQDAFGSPAINKDTISKALATFERTIVSNKAPFDRWVEGDEGAISESAKRGFVLFNGKANCAACHSGWRFTDDSFHDIGLKSQDIGRGAHVPGVVPMQHAFKTPTLRNIALREPYMHDGSAVTLREVVVHYDTGFVERPSLSPEMKRLGLGEAEIRDLVAFMQTLTSQDDAITVPVLPTKELGPKEGS